MCRTAIAALAAALLLGPGFAGAVETKAAAEPPPATHKPSATVTDTVAQAIASEDLRRAALARLEPAGRWRELAQRATTLEAELDSSTANAPANPQLIDVIRRARQLRVLHRDVSAIVNDLGVIVRQLERDRNALDSDAREWQERRVFLGDRLAPTPVLERARSIEVKLYAASARVREYRDDVLLALDRALALLARVDDARALVAAQEEQVRAQRTQLEESSLWRLGAAPAHFDLVAAEVRTAGRLLGDYFAREGTALAGLFFGVLALTIWLFTRGPGHDARSAQRAYGRPVAASLLIALMALWWLSLDPPLLFYEALLVLVPIPAAMLARNALPAPIPLTLYGVALATMLIPLRGAVDASAIAGRAVLLLQAMSIAVPVAIDLHRGRLQQALRRVSPGAVRAGALLVIAAAVVAAFNVIFGFMGPARSLRLVMGSLLGFGLVFGASAFALYGAVLALLATPLLRWLRSARTADPALLRAVRLVLTVLAVGGVAIVTLGTFGLIPTMQLASQSLISATLQVGTTSIAVNAVATALAVIFATIVLTGITGFILDREIVPRLQLRPGAGFAIVTFTRWTMIIIGAALALASLGVDMAKVTLLASAVGVGIGFGLQNVVNNFVSGLILIVERPVGVGDLIEVGPLLGEVKRIGIRSSTVRTVQGAEVIVPNGELVSKEVVNWTRSDRQRRYDIDVGVAYGSDPEQVMRLLVEAARDVPEIMTNPAPLAMFKGFGDSSLDFRLLAWVQTVDVGLQAQNGLRVAILRKLDSAGIAIPFPQRDVHIHSADDSPRPVTG
jgi:small-conductance mechanosensitive channel